MRLAISNIAWDPAEDRAVAALLQRYHIDAIDVAPSKYFPDPAQATKSAIEAVRRWWSDHGIAITGMQSLLFGTTGLNVFGSATSQNAMLQHLDAVFFIAAHLGATRLVFGSPKNRDRSGLTDEVAQEFAIHFFRRLGDLAQTHGVTVCLEPNPGVYGANFMTTTPETARIVALVDHAAIRMQLDTGALTVNQEDPAVILEHYSTYIGHIHLSEPHLVPLGDGETNHVAVARSLAKHLPDRLGCIEMLATAQEPHLQAIERALQTADRHYRAATG